MPPGDGAEPSDAAGPRPRIAVVVPAYNVERFVAATLHSVIDQTVTDWECIVVDDGSTDGTAAAAAEVIRQEPRMRLVRQPNRGLSGARNAGLRELSPSVEYVAFLDSDDTWCPTALADLVGALQCCPEAVGAWGWAELMDERGEPLLPGFHPERQRDRRGLSGWRLRTVAPDEPLSFGEVVVAGPIWPPAVGLHRRSAVAAVGSFDESLQQLEDWDFYTRMTRHGRYVPVLGQVAWYRQHPGQMTRRTVEFVCNLDRVRRKTWASPDNSPSQRTASLRAWRQLQFRRSLRTGERLARAVAGRRWAEVTPLALGTAVLAGQLVAGRPPRTTPRQVRWTQRTV
ncbi:Glycosyltransferase involved in cell wall bisynthesis [Geodermatophilus pulveris]|uniref:Glycosyltransferase involved in cell wall bisynthesis n=1 Tax=Geodermatophilus pulveris TaxID=1564159 RepID=A0A239J6V0_9ACTN|nr:glycosyltransferase family 2 protein [Geodermatophilus pulveris]SNT01499.1 Glycosyltransferase involved in cell wall bisynthesis [Geodermatophilus pulveris]